jgi:hypothetical protein
MHVLPTVAYHGSRYFSKPEMAAQSFQTVQAKSKGYCRDAPCQKQGCSRERFSSTDSVFHFSFISTTKRPKPTTLKGLIPRTKHC